MNWIKVENDAPAVLRALADGKKVRRDSWGAASWLQLGNDGAFWDECGSRLTCYFDFSSTWFIEPDRDIATDPQAGDLFMSGGAKLRVRFVHDGFVGYQYDDGSLGAVPLAKWTELWASKVYTRAE